MSHWAIVGPEGHCEGVVTTDADVDSHRQQLEPGCRAVPLEHGDAPALRVLGHHAVFREGRWLALPPSRARKFDRARGIRADHAVRNVDARELTITEMVAAGACGCVQFPEESDERLPVAGPARWFPPIKSFGTDTWLGRIIDVGHAGLVIRHMTEPEVDQLSAIMMAGGAYEGMSLQECWVAAHRWYTDPHVWPLVLDWRGEALQFEMIHFDDPRTHTTARGGFVTRVNGDRPTWFWPKVSAPIFEALQTLGYTKLSGHVRLDRKDWADALADRYGGQNLGNNGFAWTMSYPLATMIERCGPWPARRSATVPGVTELSLEAARQRIEVAWGDRPRKAAALKILDAWYELDNATLLDVNGHVRVIRERKPDEARLAILTPVDAPQPEVSAAVRLWCAAAGYVRLASYVPIVQARASGAIRNQLEREGFTVVREITTPDGPAMEVIANV